MAKDISYWLVKRGQNVGVEAAKKLAAQSRLGWYIAPHTGKRYAIGKIQSGAMSTRHFLTDDEGKVISFSSIDEAKAFLRDELKIPFAQVFDI
jgi:hypothetical protein